MRFRFQLAGCLLAMGLGAVVAAPSMAQHGHVAHWAPQQHTPPKSQNRPPQHQPPKNAAKPAQQGNRPNGNGGNPQGNGANRPNYVPRPSPNPSNNPNRPPSSYTPPQPQRKFSDLPPQDRQRIIENNNRYKNLPPAQRQELRDRAEQWNRLTPQQQNHIRNEVLPKWKQMPVERRQAIRQRLRVLQNMPESARNQRLNDPEFTRGMSEEDKATLRDLSHLHVGGAPDPPGE
ncbi:MAG TPA: DUF3106 domain-containing protein [Candidatus Acidoferrum sp.]|nr:DUF3106 domain-containing protein [Candidatus Acidoferrum sp.]